MQMSFVQIPPPGVAPLWSTLDDPQRAEIVATLARLIAQHTAAPSETPVTREEAPGDE
jgi:hypothetical protein